MTEKINATAARRLAENLAAKAETDILREERRRVPRDVVGDIIRGGIPPAFDDAAPSTGKTSDSPISYLYRRTPAPYAITQEQYEAGVAYAEMHASLGSIVSNAQVMFRLGQMYEQSWRQQDLDAMRFGEMLRPGEDYFNRSREPAQLYLAIKLSRLKRNLTPLSRAILDALLVKQVHVGRMASVFELNPQQMGTLVRMALWELVVQMGHMDREFEAWLSIIQRG